nr:hypothetical protein [Bacteroidota bacterium]
MKRATLFLSLLLAFSLASFGQTYTTPSSGDGSSGNPWQIATIDNLAWLQASDADVPSPSQAARWAGHYMQTANIDASSTTSWNSSLGLIPIGNNVTLFTGSYNGDGYTIDGLCINRSGTSYVAMFGYINNSTIQNLGLTNVNVVGSYYVAALVGFFNYGTIEYCYSTGSVSGSLSDIGGLVGLHRQPSSSIIQYSYSNCAVTGTGQVMGGFCGNTYGNINQCFSSGSVTATGSGALVRIGGFTGIKYHNGVINNCYSTASVSVTSTYSDVGGFVGLLESGGINKCYCTGSVSGSVTNVGGFEGRYSSGSYTYNFWDKETSGLNTSTVATGKTNSEMKTQGTYTNWDFSTIWAIATYANDGYPYLQNNEPRYAIIMGRLHRFRLERWDQLGWRFGSHIR